ncbi:sensor histidine kinase [Goodfellowiella coeruleoviolacea]|uniref:Sensor histidine kinase regulating citrate/malate metabolism n=1 Tax=Goodfellowiella coeruleoviolacea TaxID=334858 RepID=A0AAE3GDH5_9PSEU|nr:sensor histidine kinase [Goodfellowiella coeruleoviolacea]MCP2166120.1 Sensor histidine kinase regulating citrate/malate metabolism [Goodfellowiella coeruleoviolacea]
MGGRGSLARQLLGWQLVIVFALLASVALVMVVQSNTSFRDTQGRQMLSVAEDVAATPGVRASLADPLQRYALPTFAESARSLSGASYVVIMLPDRTVLTSPDPDQIGERLPLGESTVTRGRTWVGVVDELGGSIAAHVPVIGDNGRVIGMVAAGKEAPTFFAGAVSSAGDALALLGIATVLGVAGSVLLARRVKRQTLGLEPSEITGLIEHREALLHGIREGVVGLDRQHRITLVNDQARTLLSLPDDCVGRGVRDLDLNDRLVDVLTGQVTGDNQIVLRRGRVLVMNRMPIGALGAVVTLRDRTELIALRHELDNTRNTTDTLRAQAHEFTNRLHIIAGLIELGEFDEVRGYVHRISHVQDQWHAEVSAKIADPAVAALLIAKASLASEHGVGLRLAEDSRLAEVDERLSADLVTVVGNLVDNALDALVPAGRDGQHGWIRVAVRQTDDAVCVEVRDSGPGVAPDIVEEVFRHGFTTKAAEHGGPRGLGLALTRQTCVRRHGSVDVRNDGGAVFTARLPLAVEAGR